jgi:hypothetical protein
MQLVLKSTRGIPAGPAERHRKSPSVTIAQLRLPGNAASPRTESARFYSNI